MSAHTHSRDALTETYNDVKDDIKKVVAGFWKRYGGDFDELLAEANYFFLEAVRTYNPAKGDFNKWTKFRININLFEQLRRKAYRNARLKRVYRDMEHIPHRSRSFRFEVFTAELSYDAALVARLVADPSADVQLAVKERGKESPEKIKSAVAEVLRDLGWTWARIKESFREIRKALK